MAMLRLVGAGLVAALGGGGTVAPVAGQSAGAGALCAAVLPGLPGVRIVERHLRAAEAADGARPALPAHCELIGEADRHTGVDGQSYAIRFHLRLPLSWNQRFFFQGGGGSNGVLGDALGNLQGSQPDVALARGYAVVSQDSGHDNAANDRPEAGGIASFGLDPVARRNYAYASLPRVTRIAKALIARFYGQAPRFSYFVGCSKGGQEGMALAQRYPTYFDGIVANAPGFALPRAALAQAHDVQVMAAAARAARGSDGNGLPLLGRAFSDAELGIVSAAVLAACDGLDGRRDGLVAATGLCTTARVRPVLEAKRCSSIGRGDCLTGRQIDAIVTVMAGARDRAGSALYSDWAWDPGIGGPGQTEWRRWKLGGAEGPVTNARNVLLGGASLASVFTTPPTRVAAEPAALFRWQLALDLAAAARATRATSAVFRDSAWSMMAAQSADRDAFRRAGGRMIVVHGAADPVFSLNDTIDWWNRLDARYRGRAADFTRVFAVPGMNHCRGGPGTTQFPAFDALTRWVERQEAPDRIVATAPAGTPWPGRTRPLCAHPGYARYDGAGDPERSESFACIRP